MSSSSTTDGIFGDFGNVGVGFSDKVLVGVSLAGLCFLGFSVYNILVLRLKTREELEQEDETVDYEERLVNADVAGLSRAERRARARAIMKQKRRVQPPNRRNNNNNDDGEQQAQDGGEEDEQQQQIVPLLAEADGGHDNQEDATTAAHKMSRKERQKMAKAAEIEARKAMQEERRNKQKIVEEAARKEKVEREKRQAQLQQENRRKEKLEKEEAERKHTTFLSTEQCTLSVDEWIGEMQQKRSVSIDEVASRFDVSSHVVQSRIEALLREKRVLGIVTSSGRFVHLSVNELEQMMQKIEAKGVATHVEIASICNSVVSAADCK